MTLAYLALRARSTNISEHPAIMPVIQTMYFLDITCVNLDCKPVGVKKRLKSGSVYLYRSRKAYIIYCARAATRLNAVG